MNILELEQGSDQWHEERLKHCTASEAPVMMGDSSKGKRNELLALKKTGVAKEVSRYVQEKVFDPGHAMEAAARTILEDELGEDLYPVVASLVVDGIPLLASVDGQTLDGKTLFEHKGWNDELAAMVRSGELSAEYYWQLEQQLKIFGADKVLFVVSDGTKEKREILEYTPVPGRFAQLLGGWAQFLDDLQEHEVAAPAVKLVANNIANLPDLTIKLSGGVAASNLNEYKAGALAFIENINTDLQTDQHFVDARATVKFCKESEDRIKVIKTKALEDTASIKEAFDVLDELAAAMRTKRLALEKLVASREAQIKDDIRQSAESNWQAHLATINAEIGPRVRLPHVPCDIAGAMSGKRNLDSIRDAADTAVSKAKLIANDLAAKIRINLAVLRELDAKYRHLFNDVTDIILKDADDFTNLVALRVKEADDAAAEAERQRLAEEDRIREEARLQLLADQQAEVDRLAAAAAPAEEPAAPVAEAQAETVNVQAVTEKQADPAPVSRPATRTVRTETPAGRPLVAELVSLESLLLAIIDGVVPDDLVQVNQEAVTRYLEKTKVAPPGFRLASVK